MDDFLANEAKGTKVVGAHSLEEMVSKLKKPRRIILLVKAGQAVDDFIGKLVRLALRPAAASEAASPLPSFGYFYLGDFFFSLLCLDANSSVQTKRCLNVSVLFNMIGTN